MASLAIPTSFSPLDWYKEFVRRNESLVTNLERLAHWVAWSPDRFSGSEFAYEAFNSAVGLVGLLNDSIIHGESSAGDEGTDWGFMLAALEQVRRVALGRSVCVALRVARRASDAVCDGAPAMEPPGGVDNRANTQPNRSSLTNPLNKKTQPSSVPTVQRCKPSSSSAPSSSRRAAR